MARNRGNQNGQNFQNNQHNQGNQQGNRQGNQQGYRQGNQQGAQQGNRQGYRQGNGNYQDNGNYQGNGRNSGRNNTWNQNQGNNNNGDNGGRWSNGKRWTNKNCDDNCQSNVQQSQNSGCTNCNSNVQQSQNSGCNNCNSRVQQTQNTNCRHCGSTNGVAATVVSVPSQSARRDSDGDSIMSMCPCAQGQCVCSPSQTTSEYYWSSLNALQAKITELEQANRDARTALYVYGSVAEHLVADADKTQLFNLLSGGEKAQAALALVPTFIEKDFLYKQRIDVVTHEFTQRRRGFNGLVLGASSRR